MVTIIFILVSTLVLVTYANSISPLDEFTNYKKQVYDQFSSYKKQIEKEFEGYKKIYKEEFQKYKNSILNLWYKEAEFSEKHKFVEYSKDKKSKKVVDFDQKVVKVSVIEKNKQKAVEKIKANLSDLLKEDKLTAYKRDMVLQNVRKKTSKFKYVKKDKITNQLIVGDLLLNKVDKQNIKKFVEKNVVKEKIKKEGLGNNKIIYTLTLKFPEKSIYKKAFVYKPIVEQVSRKYKIDPYLIFAVIHTESAYNPYAKSPVPAYGLMQIVPFTAGKDITEFLYGKPYILSPEFLFNEKNNILSGTVYLFLLQSRYLKGIKNPESRLYCAIASYNTGIGNLAKTFVGKPHLKKAIAKINKLTAEEVFHVLIEKLPYKETRDYLKKVNTRIKFYKNLFGENI